MLEAFYKKELATQSCISRALQGKDVFEALYKKDLAAQSCIVAL